MLTRCIPNTMTFSMSLFTNNSNKVQTPLGAVTTLIACYTGAWFQNGIRTHETLNRCETGVAIPPLGLVSMACLLLRLLCQTWSFHVNFTTCAIFLKGNLIVNVCTIHKDKITVCQKSEVIYWIPVYKTRQKGTLYICWTELYTAKNWSRFSIKFCCSVTAGVFENLQ